ncbi:E3 ubiquitin-protein ligase ATL9-like [Solanum dulcamara]|uniref:E3 ubiquitin-protein ligase ATL9-like n=1 Tax=Solanum dulcamara TaxID=45834 RepID=UPI00248579C9|nr:E3 ubiquitin-protein ligase ATL9-like [Solanum dulcamara]
MAALTRCFFLFYKVYPILFCSWILQVVRFMLLASIVFWNSCRYAIAYYKYKEMFNKKSCKFVFRRKKRVESIGQGSLDCAICLSEFEHGERGRKLETCKHIFHENCLEKWLMQKDIKASCPLCRSVIISEEIKEEYRKLEDEGKRDHSFEKELALLLLSILNRGYCHCSFSPF